MNAQKMHQTLLQAKAEKILRPVQDWLDASKALRMKCKERPKRWRDSREREGFYFCSKCGRTALDPERTCYPLIGDKFARLPERREFQR